MRPVVPSAVMIEIDGAKQIRDPVLSVDYDLQHLTAVMDAFLVVLFSQKSET